MHIDLWTLALQTINVLILVWLLARFFFRPIQALIIERRDSAARLLSDAAAVRQAADAALAEAARKRDAIDQERTGLIADAQRAARVERDNRLAETRVEIEKLRSDAAAAIRRDRAAADLAITSHAEELAIEIARRLLARLPPEAGSDVFVGELCGQLRALSRADKQGLVSEASRRPIEVRIAAALSNEQIERIRRAVSEALGAGPALAFRQDPDLLAGIEFHSGNFIVSNSWRADLVRIREELNCDKGSDIGAR